MTIESRPNEIFKVKMDKNWNLCPIATKLDTELRDNRWNIGKTEVLFSNNESCIRYLENKLPTGINCNIWRDNSKQDYTIESYWYRATIEPMTIAGDWVSEDLWKNLAFLNLSNYIESKWRQYGGKHPSIDFKFKDGKIVIKGLKNDAWTSCYMNVELNKFWFLNVTRKELSNFKTYNNDFEAWIANWDTRESNRIYRKLYLN